MKTIGIVAEGPWDFELIAAVIDTITNKENNYQMIQPEPNMIGQFGKRGFFSLRKVTEAHPNQYYFERIDTCDNALVRSFFAQRKEA